MKYQYKSVSINGVFKTSKKMTSEFQKVLDQYSNDGWELVNYQAWDTGTKILIVFKKEIYQI
jgi:hypothetical protein